MDELPSEDVWSYRGKMYNLIAVRYSILSVQDRYCASALNIKEFFKNVFMFWPKRLDVFLKRLGLFQVKAWKGYERVTFTITIWMSISMTLVTGVKAKFIKTGCIRDLPLPLLPTGPEVPPTDASPWSRGWWAGFLHNHPTDHPQCGSCGSAYRG